MDDMEMIDISDNVVKKDKFMTRIYISLIVLIITGLVVYFFGYNLFKPLIQV